MVFITYGKLLEQKIIRPFKSHRGQLPKFIDILNHVGFESKKKSFCVHYYFHDPICISINEQRELS